MNEAVIQMQALTHRYGKFTAVKDVNLIVNRGEIFGFLGPNGAGKTTTIRTLLDFIRPTEGSAKIFGLDIRQHSVEIRSRLGYMPSELTLWENWTGAQYVRWLSQVHGKNVMPEAERLAERLQYDLKRSLSGMSTGMKRKMGLIAALVHKPELLILDEPTNGLDPLMQAAFHELMLEAKAEGRTVFLSSHILPEVEHICDRVGIIRAGELQAVETIENLTRVAFRWMTLVFDQPVRMNGFNEVYGISNYEAQGNQIKMKVSGSADLDRLIKLAAQHTVTELKFEQPTLEEVFLAYYGDRSN
ncbi:MAG: ABC transporter ATP-binding protein [Anaerolineae bacterium]|nr:ABC transporter ATP-binding protein [Anaerolineae bacterium]